MTSKGWTILGPAVLCAVLALATGAFAPSPAVRARKEAISSRVTLAIGQYSAFGTQPVVTPAV